MRIRISAHKDRRGLICLLVGVAFISVTSISQAQTSRPLPEPSHAAATVTQREVTIDVGHDNIVGTLSLPTTGRALPAVVILHGFAPERDGIPVKTTEEGMLSRPARQWAERAMQPFGSAPEARVAPAVVMRI
jgi:hypothetical protein